MLKTFWGKVKQGKIELLEPSELVEGTQVLVTLIPNNESDGEEDKSLKSIPRQGDFIDELKANPIRVRNWLKLNREELHDRS
ncbi:MAG: hypothetical protein F6K18_14075 [Okeania sp. SIO2C2]|uniref:hypothetical protein n=1 Tax=Okeania sp. SIO2C2 TaxID=2607787 RepID=UPI0013BCA9C1|nr:hypothetical protein [Okeania sp. SIO2C2]NEP87853.1 hypothetical protein [Okeania sp. SIO2C2]NES68293.1 hypothetical protein [Okeania sp. SIO2D1]